MTSLISHSAGNPHKSANDILRDVTAMMSANAPQAGNVAAFLPPGQRTPGLNGPSQFASPPVGNMGLPGPQASPHLGGSAHQSPAPNHLMGPGMIAQQGQGGLTANGTSANTSPNVSNKRRRASTVKTEVEDGAEINGTNQTGANKVRASPKVGGKRHKGAA